MLVLTRRVGEAVQIGDEITVSVERIQGNNIRLGIKAPVEIPIHRVDSDDDAVDA